MKTYLIISALAIALLLPVCSHAETFCVSDATGLQTALTTASGNGEDDTVQIEQGSYVGSFVYASTEAFSLTVEGGYTVGCTSRVVDPVNTVLDANETGSVLVFSTPHTIVNLTVDGLTLQNGVAVNSGHGGGISIATNGDVIISNNTIRRNTAFRGGGFWASVLAFGTTTFTNNTITENSAEDYGGGVSASSYAGAITLTNNTIMGNWSNYRGGGIYIDASSDVITLTNNTITENSSNHGAGGGIYLYSPPSTITFTKNTITWNSTGYKGGGALINDCGAITFTKNIIVENSANDYGGGVDVGLFRGSITFTNNIITRNSTNKYGGGINAAIRFGSISFTNNTITHNSANDYGGGINLLIFENNDMADFVNNIIWNNTSVSLGSDLYLENDRNGDDITGIVNLYNNDFDQSAGGTYIQIPFTIDPSNLDNEDPLFVDATGGNYHLTNSSPCFDTGRLEGAPEDDIDGDARPFGTAVDIGADEHIGMCKGNFDYDNDVDGTDASLFKAHFGRSIFENPCPPDGPAPAEQTGQTTSYVAGDDGEHQSGVPFPEPRFVDNEDGTIRDNLTGLIWLKNANCFSQRVWADAISDCNGLASESCGLTDGSSAGDWRLPSRKELFSLIHDSYSFPAVPDTEGTGQWSEGDPFTNVQSYYYWSSTTVADSTVFAWTVKMAGGGVGIYEKVYSGVYVWPVRGGH